MQSPNNIGLYVPKRKEKNNRENARLSCDRTKKSILRRLRQANQFPKESRAKQAEQTMLGFAPLSRSNLQRGDRGGGNAAYVEGVFALLTDGAADSIGDVAKPEAPHLSLAGRHLDHQPEYVFDDEGPEAYVPEGVERQ